MQDQLSPWSVNKTPASIVREGHVALKICQLQARHFGESSSAFETKRNFPLMKASDTRHGRERKTTTVQNVQSPGTNEKQQSPRSPSALSDKPLLPHKDVNASETSSGPGSPKREHKHALEAGEQAQQYRKPKDTSRWKQYKNSEREDTQGQVETNLDSGDLPTLLEARSASLSDMQNEQYSETCQEDRVSIVADSTSVPEGASTNAARSSQGTLSRVRRVEVDPDLTHIAEPHRVEHSGPQSQERAEVNNEQVQLPRDTDRRRGRQDELAPTRKGLTRNGSNDLGVAGLSSSNETNLFENPTPLAKSQPRESPMSKVASGSSQGLKLSPSSFPEQTGAEPSTERGSNALRQPNTNTQSTATTGTEDELHSISPFAKSYTSSVLDNLLSGNWLNLTGPDQEIPENAVSPQRSSLSGDGQSGYVTAEQDMCVTPESRACKTSGPNNIADLKTRGMSSASVRNEPLNGLSTQAKPMIEDIQTEDRSNSCRLSISWNVRPNETLEEEQTGLKQTDLGAHDSKSAEIFQCDGDDQTGIEQLKIEGKGLRACRIVVLLDKSEELVIDVKLRDSGKQ